MTLSVVIITYNEEANIGRTLASVQSLVSNGNGEVVVVDSGSTDRTVEIANSLGAKVLVESWKGYAAQKNSAIEKATGDWILSLDADEEVDPELAHEIARLVLGRSTDSVPDDMAGRKGSTVASTVNGFWVYRKNSFLGRWIKHGGFWPDPKLRLFRKASGSFENRAVHEDVRLTAGHAGQIKGALVHHCYPNLADYIDHMNHYSSLGAEMAVAGRHRGFSAFDILLRPAATFLYNYFFRLGFLDGREGLLLHIYHAVYVSWKYAKAWELSRAQRQSL